MDEKKVARTVAEAVVGDFLWHFDHNASVYRDGKYVGRGKWSLAEVQTVGRLSVEVGSKHYPNSWGKYARDTGQARGSSNGYRPYLCGYDQRTEQWWIGQADRIAKLVKECRDIETLKSLAHLMGTGGPPDFRILDEP